MAQPIDAYVSGWQRAFDYEGRTNRGDYWWFVLANLIVVVVLLVLSGFIEAFRALTNIYVIAQIVPHLPLTIRRLRDSGKPWPWIFISLVPLIGGIWLIVLLVQASIPG
ncbi:DUF805 domain-containing protein [Cyanobium sp. Morenito 9A2]|uniref:DUF805 domain-containing protein n=1 Tax=Cyanobium sp. Morenito 9A2 TaxID=2823718 RepID=UPI0020CD3C75|nr:DUF805 domain-containing protein [Cyanobium sp. Morenito 9A2]MCP9849458.1 DUF805 domain-containing protein [Cyanobium sp. Morenito 9A2]